MHELDAVGRALVAAGYEPRPHFGNLLVVLERKSLLYTTIELEISFRKCKYRLTIRYRRQLRNGNPELRALTAKANELGLLMANEDYDGHPGYDDDTNSGFVEWYTYVREGEPLECAISRLKVFADCCFNQLESAGRIIH